MDTLHRTIEDLKTQRAEMVDQVQLLDDAIRSLERIVKRDNHTVQVTQPPRSRPAKRKGPGTSKAVITILDDAGRPLYDDEILAEMQRREWAPPSPTPLNALRATLSRLKGKGEIIREGGDQGPYRLPQESEASREQEASEPFSNQGGHMDPP
jgi:hypothetical protein